MQSQSIMQYSCIMLKILTPSSVPFGNAHFQFMQPVLTVPLHATDVLGQGIPRTFKAWHNVTQFPMPSTSSVSAWQKEITPRDLTADSRALSCRSGSKPGSSRRSWPRLCHAQPPVESTPFALLRRVGTCPTLGVRGLPTGAARLLELSTSPELLLPCIT